MARGETQRRARQRGARIRAVRRGDRRGRARLRVRRHRHAGQQFLSDAARPFARRHAGFAAQRQLRRRRRVLARPPRPLAARRGRPIRRPGDGGAAQAANRRQRNHRLGDGAQPHRDDRQQQRAPGRPQHRAPGERAAVPRRRRPARSRHLPRTVPDRAHRARSDRGGGRPASATRRARRGARSRAWSRRSICPAAPRASSICRRAGSGTTASPNTTASSAPPTGAPAERAAPRRPSQPRAKPLSSTARDGDRADEDGRALHAKPIAGDFGRHSDQEPPRHARRGDRLGPAPGLRRLRDRRRRRRRRRGRVRRRVVRRRALPSAAPTTRRRARCGRAISACRWRAARSSPSSTTTTAGDRSPISRRCARRSTGRHAATLASGDIVVVDDDMRVLETMPFAASTSPEAIRRDNKILVSGFAFSRALSGRLGPFDETLPIYWDWDWYLRLHAAGVAFHDLGPQAVTIAAHRQRDLRRRSFAPARRQSRRAQRQTRARSADLAQPRKHRPRRGGGTLTAAGPRAPAVSGEAASRQRRVRVNPKLRSVGQVSPWATATRPRRCTGRNR